ncbi:hypothetical protein Scep_027686 [Stephania cephalantha]|uniref:Uncharacterized protein n=1 Tax=Stephania cephalantha TaxID=152367 RepID=A0AAP0HIR3_9MAGN
MGLNPLSEHLPCVVALPLYSSSIVVEHPISFVSPLGSFLGLQLKQADSAK